MSMGRPWANRLRQGILFRGEMRRCTGAECLTSTSLGGSPRVVGGAIAALSAAIALKRAEYNVQ